MAGAELTSRADSRRAQVCTVLELGSWRVERGLCPSQLENGRRLPHGLQIRSLGLSSLSSSDEECNATYYSNTSAR